MTGAQRANGGNSRSGEEQFNGADAALLVACSRSVFLFIGLSAFHDSHFVTWQKSLILLQQQRKSRQRSEDTYETPRVTNPMISKI
jgi:hypothetical protein